MKTLGIILLAIGLLMTIITGFTVITKKNVANIGPVEINKKEQTPIYWSPVTGGILAIGGIAFLLVGRNKNK